MEKPDCAELDAILTTVSHIMDAEAHIILLKARLSAEAKGLSAVDDRTSRIQAAVYAYWFAPEAHASDLSFGATGRSYAGELRQYAGAVPTGIHCDRCEAEVEITSREQMKTVLSKSKRESNYAEGYRILCGECREAVFEEREVESERLAAARAARGQAVARMSYTEYLGTEDWHHQREQHLAHLLWASKMPLQCEACAAADRLGVYHRNLDALGLRDDVVLLCDTCRDALIGAGRLAGDPGPQNRIGKAHAVLLAQKYLDMDTPV